MRTDLLGWFEDSSPVTKHDPGTNAPCIVCMKLLSSPMKTVSFMPVICQRSFFFRVHKICWESLLETEQEAYTSAFVDDIAAGEMKINP